jgi:type II secretory ATPase GspE/PulE/Tfp pilus assembly ATPase PilB-like protein
MVGEIRDGETAKTALEASLTGHLVLSTLHTNNAPESIVRLLEMGMNPFNFSDSLLGILAQRLVRCLCRKCRQPVVAKPEMLLRLAREYSVAGSPDESDLKALTELWLHEYGHDGEITLYRSRGCPHRANTGYKGRIGLFELMPASTQAKRHIIEKAPPSAPFDLALHEGMQTLKQGTAESTYEILSHT